MPERIQLLAEYLVPPANSFWQWQNQGNVVAWPDGTTIAFRPELRPVLERLAPAGLPPLGSVVLLLAACRESWPIASSQFVTLYSTLASLTGSSMPPWFSDFLSDARRGPKEPLPTGPVPNWFSELSNRLDDIRRLPREARESSESRALLAEIIFEETARRLPLVSSIELLDALDQHDGVSVTPRSKLESESPLVALFHELHALSEGLARFDPATLELRRRTGLDQWVEPAELELAPSEQARELIATLEDDEELGGVARVARRLLAAATLPRPLAENEELPLGGVSDITNRGPLDRLLLSELAHDDTTLAVRVALHEALYLRRETPPRNPPRRRAVLIDAGLRMWGVPRVYAAAVALALAATSDPKAQVTAYRAAGQDVEQAQLTTRAGLLEHLAALQAEVEPSAAFAPFFEALEDGSEPTDAVLITTDDVLADADFQRSLAALETPLLFIAAINRAGDFRLIQMTRRGQKVVREARLDLDALLAPRNRPAVPLVDQNVDPLWPAIFSATPFPLLLSAAVEPEKMWPALLHEGSGMFSIANDRRLLYWQDSRHGARQLFDQVPKGIVQWFLNPQAGSMSYAVVGPRGSPNLQLIAVDLETDQCRTYPLALHGAPTKGVFAHAGTLVVVQERLVVAFQLTDGRHIDSIALPPGSLWAHGRFFRGRGGWLVFSHDGLAGRWEPVSAASGRVTPPLVSMFDCPACDGPVGVTPEGALYFVTSGKLAPLADLPIAPPVTLAEVSADGNRLLLTSIRAGQTPSHALVNVPNVASWPMSDVTGQFFHSERRFKPHPISLRNKFETLHISARGELVLTTPKGKTLRVTLDAKQDQVCIYPAESVSTSDTARVFSFTPHVAPEGVGYTLRQAAWTGGRAILDSRGMLHLQLANSRTPELTLVLCDGAIALWSSDGRLSGPPYFTGGQGNALPSDLYRQVLEPIIKTMS